MSGITPAPLGAGLALPYTADAPAGQNGRVAFADIPAAQEPSIPGYSSQTATETNFKDDMLRGNWESSPLSDAFFSAENAERLQTLIRKAVYDRSQPKGYVVDRQSADELKIIMRAIYYQYARNLPYDIKSQLEDLNEKVVNYAAPHILSAVDSYFYYLKDISQQPVPMAHPMHLSRAGTKTMPTNPFM